MRPNILVIRLSSLGDVVLTIPVYKNLKAHWPQCRISVLVKPQYAAVLQDHPCIDEVIVFRGLWNALTRIRTSSFTHLLDLHATFRSFLLCRFSGIANIIRYHKDALARRLFVRFRLSSPALTRHTIDRYLESIHAWDVPTPVHDIRIEDYSAYGDRAKTGATDNNPISTMQDNRLPQRVLIVQTAFLGDATLTVPLTREMKKIAPYCRITVLTRPDTADIFHSCQWVDETLIDDKRGAKSRSPLAPSLADKSAEGGSHAGVRGVFLLARKLKSKNFDLALIPHRSFRSALAVWLANIPTRIGFSSSAGRFFLTRTIPFTWGMHDLERNLGLLLPLRSVSNNLPSVYLNLRSSQNGHGTISQRLKEAGIPSDARLIGIHPGSVWPTKRWPADRYARLISRLTQEAYMMTGGEDTQARDLRTVIVVVGGPGDAELASWIIRGSRTSALNWCGKTTLTELMELMGRLKLFITNDSGPMHVATASGVPTLAIFGPTTRELGFFPYGPGHEVLEADLACRPCGLHGAKACPEGHFLCMKLISVDQVFQTALQMLRQNPIPSVR